MQYPIIDIITDAYINNGWTGLDISTEQGSLNSNTGEPIDNTTRVRTIFLNVNEINYIYNNIGNATVLSSRCYNNTQTYIGNATLLDDGVKSTIVNVPAGTVYIRFIYHFPNNAVITPNDVLITINSKFIDIFKHCLKLPLPHYFPRPVIDALQRAAAGTQTADDTEVLRHYLTPLGIGGI